MTFEISDEMAALVEAISSLRAPFADFSAAVHEALND